MYGRDYLEDKERREAEERCRILLASLPEEDREAMRRICGHDKQVANLAAMMGNARQADVGYGGIAYRGGLYDLVGSIFG